LAVCDFCTDRVYTNDISDEGKLTEIAEFEAPAGTGPRHLVFHPNGKYAYLFGELDSTVTVLSYNASTGKFTQKNKISTIPKDYHDFNGGAAIRITS
ncbi:beta-propeller fold lactonase family protein, partial [Lactiplantibacillus plantarum]|uniref:beta-propeller fold lactonase family protein n=1 Tax=Lactiplantibacillus plantarum TaxID=1590 RepID=UPI003C1905AD